MIDLVRFRCTGLVRIRLRCDMCPAVSVEVVEGQGADGLDDGVAMLRRYSRGWSVWSQLDRCPMCGVIAKFASRPRRRRQKGG